MKRHLKRIAVPRTWVIDRKKRVFITRPKPGAHSLSMGLPLGVILRDKLGTVKTLSEARKLLNNNEILVDGKRRKDHRFIVGLLDVISVPGLDKYYRVRLNKKGKLVVAEIAKEESSKKVCKIVGKCVLPKGQIQFNLHDGRNLSEKIEARVGDSLLVELPSFSVNKVLPLKAGVTIFLTQGKHVGDIGVLKEIQDNEAKYENNGEMIETAKGYVFVIGEKGPLIKIENE